MHDMPAAPCMAVIISSMHDYELHYRHSGSAAREISCVRLPVIHVICIAKYERVFHLS